MRQVRAVWKRLRNQLAARDLDRDFGDELDTLFAMHLEENLRAGMPEGEARRRAHVAVGSTAALTDIHRASRGIPSLEIVGKDLRYAVRMVQRNPGFALVVVVSLAVGIGANSAIFSVANAVMLRALPVPDAAHVYAVRYESRLPTAQRYSYPLFEQLRAASPHPDLIAAMSRVGRMPFAVADGDQPQPGSIQLVTPAFFATLGLRPIVGRFFTDAENRLESGHDVTVVSYGFWQRRLGGRPEAIGRTISINNTRVTVIGVAPAGFSGVWLESPVDAWLPTAIQARVRYAQNFSANRADASQPWVPQAGMSWLEIIARAERPDGQDIAALNAAYRPLLLKDAESVAEGRERELFLERQLVLESFAHGFSTLRQRFRLPLIALMSMVGLLLLIACANTANLLLARATARQREMAVRLSIGASRQRLIAQLLTESMLLAAIAAVLGLISAPWIAELLVRWTIGGDRPLPFSVGVDGRVLLFTAALSILTSVLFGAAPAARSANLTLASALKDGGRSVRGSLNRKLANTLVVAQVMLSLVLIIAAGLFARSFSNLQTVDVGFEAEHLLSVRFNTYQAGYETSRLPALHSQLLTRVKALPGVRSAVLASCGLISGCRSSADGIVIDGYTPQAGEQVLLQQNLVGANYFNTVGMALVAGREFEPPEFATEKKVAVINEALARRYFMGRDPVGLRLGYDRADTEIVGVVRDARVNTVREEPAPMAFYPLKPDVHAGTLEVRTVGDPKDLETAVRAAFNEVDRAVPVDRVTVVARNAQDSIRQEQVIAILATVLGLAALALACLGVFGLMSYHVRQRTAELGVRVALGALRSQVLWMILRQSMALIGIGVAAGMLVVLASAGLLKTLLYNVDPRDLQTIVGSVVLLLLVGSLAGYLPARRAARVDPLVALRQE